MENTNQTATPAENGGQEKTFTQSELDAFITARLERERKRAEAEKAEAERVAKMTAEEKLQEQLKAFEAERTQFAKEKLEMETIKTLADTGLNTEFSKFLIGADSDSTKANIETFQTLFNSAIQEAVDKRLKTASNPPKSATQPVQKTKAAHEYSLNEMADMQTNNPDLFAQIFKK